MSSITAAPSPLQSWIEAICSDFSTKLPATGEVFQAIEAFLGFPIADYPTVSVPTSEKRDKLVKAADAVKKRDLTLIGWKVGAPAPVPTRRTVVVATLPPAELPVSTGDPLMDALLARRREEASAPKGLTEEQVRKIVNEVVGKLPKAVNRKEVDDIVSSVIGSITPPKARIDKEDADEVITALLGAKFGDVFSGFAIGRSKSDATTVEAPALVAAYTPKVDKTFVIDTDSKAVMNMVVANAKKKGAENIMLTGPAGCGKSEWVAQMAAHAGLPMLKLDCPNIRESSQWFGSRGASNGSTHWTRSQFELAVSGGNIVILLDEFNRVSDYVRNPLMTLLDNHRCTLVQELGAVIRVGHNTIFASTMNKGGAYTGVHNVDKAMDDRFPILQELTYLPEAEEAALLVARTGVALADAKRLAALANAIRAKASSLAGGISTGIGTRQLLAATEAFQAIGKNGLLITIANHYTAEGGTDSERAQVRLMIEGKFPR